MLSSQFIFNHLLFRLKIYHFICIGILVSLSRRRRTNPNLSSLACIILDSLTIPHFSTRKRNDFWISERSHNILFWKHSGSCLQYYAFLSSPCLLNIPYYCKKYLTGLLFPGKPAGSLIKYTSAMLAKDQTSGISCEIPGRELEKTFT